MSFGPADPGVARCLDDHPAARPGRGPDHPGHVSRIGGDDDDARPGRGGGLDAERRGREAGILGGDDITMDGGSQQCDQIVGSQGAMSRHQFLHVVCSGAAVITPRRT